MGHHWSRKENLFHPEEKASLVQERKPPHPGEKASLVQERRHHWSRMIVFAKVVGMILLGGITLALGIIPLIGVRRGWFPWIGQTQSVLTTRLLSPGLLWRRRDPDL